MMAASGHIADDFLTFLPVPQVGKERGGIPSSRKCAACTPRATGNARAADRECDYGHC